MKKLWLVVLSAVFLLVGCESTDPSMEEMFLKNYGVENVESEHLIRFSMENAPIGLAPNGQKIQQVLDMLEAGIKVEAKQDGYLDSYMKFSLVDPEPLRELGVWDADADPELVVYQSGQQLIGKTSTEERFVSLDLNSELLQPSSVQPVAPIQEMSEEDAEKLIDFLQGAMEDYLEQFDYELRDIEDHGEETVETPEGEEDTRHITVKLNVQDIQDFIAYTIGNLAEYEGYEEMLEGFIELFGETFAESLDMEGIDMEDLDTDLTDEEREQMKEALLEVKERVENFDIKEAFGFEPDVLLTLDLFLKDDGQIVKNRTEFSMAVPMNMGAPGTDLPDSSTVENTISLKWSIESAYWNYGDVDLDMPNQAEAIPVERLLESEAELEQLNEDSFIRKMLKEHYHTKTGHLEIGSPVARINGKPVVLDAAPYIAEGGHAMVPIRTIAEIAKTEPVWNGETREITFAANGHTVTVQIGNRTALVDGQRVEMPVAPVIDNDRSFVPLRFVTENLGASVKYDANARTIDIRF